MYRSSNKQFWLFSNGRINRKHELALLYLRSISLPSNLAYITPLSNRQNVHCLGLGPRRRMPCHIIIRHTCLVVQNSHCTKGHTGSRTAHYYPCISRQHRIWCTSLRHNAICHSNHALPVAPMFPASMNSWDNLYTFLTRP